MFDGSNEDIIVNNQIIHKLYMHKQSGFKLPFTLQKKHLWVYKTKILDQ